MRLVQTIQNAVVHATTSIWMFNNVSVSDDIEFNDKHVHLCSLVKSVCNLTICGENNTCIDSELALSGYICACNDTNDVFNGTTCVGTYRRETDRIICISSTLSIEKNSCNALLSQEASVLPCSKAYQKCLPSRSSYSCACEDGFDNSSSGCTRT